MREIKKYAYAAICVFFAMAAFVFGAISAYGGGAAFDAAAIISIVLAAAAFHAVIKIEN